MKPARPRRRHDFVIRLIVPRPVPSFTPGIKERRCGFADSRRKARLSGHQRSPNHRKGGHFMKRILCLTLFVVLAIGAPTFAATKSNKSSDTGGEIGFGVGQSDVSSDSIGTNSAQFLGVRGGYHLNQQWQVEGQFASSSENGDISGTSVDSTMRLYMVNGVMNFHPRGKKDLVPYVMAGIGRADVSVDAGGISASDNSVAYQVGGGTRIFFGKSKTMAFRADLSLLRDTAFQNSSTLTTVTAGLTWKLGGR
ncbi:MAG: hypothetical protein DMF52_14905 [Acidobacteria bacterium]|nr:MAG: hypothetical protein DMF52_14905 [Acidobacteriota bacterium]